MSLKYESSSLSGHSLAPTCVPRALFRATVDEFVLDGNLGITFFFSSLLLSSLELSDTKVYEPRIRALLGTSSHFC